MGQPIDALFGMQDPQSDTGPQDRGEQLPFAPGLHLSDLDMKLFIGICRHDQPALFAGL